MAKYYLFFLKIFFGLRVIGITGSVGKTTTKEMIFQVLAQKYKTVATFANIDPVYNIPTTILKCTPNTQFLILEMGVEYPGDMDFYLWLDQPDIGVLTSIYWTHTQFLKDIEGVAKEKGKLIWAVPKNGWVILNGDDKRVKEIGKKAKAQVFLYGLGSDAQVRARDIKTEDFRTLFTLEMGQIKEIINLKTLGEHFVYAALAAAAIGKILNVPILLIKRGLEEVTPQPRRLNVVPGPKGSVILDDTYNASPLATFRALETARKVAAGGEVIAVLGDMKELGRFSQAGHLEVGDKVVNEKVGQLFTIGEEAKIIGERAKNLGMPKTKIHQYISPTPQLSQNIVRRVKWGDVILIKGSRHAHLERLVLRLMGKKSQISCPACGELS